MLRGTIPHPPKYAQEAHTGTHTHTDLSDPEVLHFGRIPRGPVACICVHMSSQTE